MKRFLITFSFLFLFLFFPSLAHAACDDPVINIAPQSGPTNIPYSVRLSLRDCNESTVTLLLQKTGSSGEKRVALVKDNESNLYINQAMRFESEGQWSAFAIFLGAPPFKNIEPPVAIAVANPTTAPNASATIQPGQKQCGDVTSNGMECPSHCPATPKADESGKFICDSCIEEKNIPDCDPNYALEGKPQICKTASQQCPGELKVCMNKADWACQTTRRVAAPTPPCADPTPSKDGCKTFTTALGDIATDPMAFIKWIFGLLLGLSGGIAIVLIIISGYQLMTSQGSKEGVQAARERITSAIVGLLFLIFSLVILQIIGVDILSIPGFS